MMTLTSVQMQLADLEKKIRTVQKYILRTVYQLDAIRFHDGDVRGAERPDFNDQDWPSFAIGQTWGGQDRLCWFRIPFTCEKVTGDEKPAVLIQPGKRFVFKSSEGGDLREYELLAYLDGRPLQSIDVRRNLIPLHDLIKPGQRHLLALEAFSGLEAHVHVFEQADLVAIHPQTEAFYYTARNLLDCLIAIGESHVAFPRLIVLLERALLQVDFLQAGSATFFDSIAHAHETLQKELGPAPTSVAGSPVVLCLGHSHLDLAWKWRVRHSIKKAARTCANALRLMELYPEFRYSQSQAQLYQWMQIHQPALFAQIREKIASGQWEATGGMWVESDCNIPNGESLVRQFLFGKRYFRRELSSDPQTAWLPDCFGFCYSLPQIMKECGIRRFVTTKLSWNQFTSFPHDTFLWQGVDGTRILCHFITTPDRRGWSDYSVDLNPATVKGCWDSYRQQQINNEVLLSFGWGDGGGGPTAEMLENGRRLNAFSALPVCRQGSVEGFFHDLEQRLSDLPVWNDELYLQLHRGTYTSQAKIKKQNRVCEALLHHMELLSSIAYLRSGWYPQAEINRAWESVLLNQFHDILPGSSIVEVYQDCDQAYEKVQQTGADIIRQALERIGPVADDDPTAATVYNPLSWTRSDLLKIPIEPGAVHVPCEHDVPLPFQLSHDRTHVLVSMRKVPSMGLRRYTLTEASRRSAASSNRSLHITPDHLENRFFYLRLDETGAIISIWDKRYNREIIAEGARANRFQIFEDRPMANEAWDIDVYYQKKTLELNDLVSSTAVETGPLRGGLKQQYKFLSSQILQYLYIYDEIPRIDFITEIDWRQHQTLLKTAFPLNIHSSRATYEIPFGVIERPAHWNTDWDKARFEVAAQKWADLSEGDYGVSLLNDCKYGYDVKDNVMRLTLIKSGIDPDPAADIGLHRFSYALYPHFGDWRIGGTVRMAYEFNYPLMFYPLAGHPQAGPDDGYSFVTPSAENLVVETVKKAEDRPGLIVRVYETYNQRGNASLIFAEKIKKAVTCNGLEEEQGPVKFHDHTLEFYIKPFQLRTFYVEF